MKKLQDKIAIITGGSRGIGAAIARRFAKEGCHVALSFNASKDKALSLVKELEDEGVKAIAIQADQANPEEVRKFIEKAHEEFGHIDILVNNAGIFATGTIDNPSLEISRIQKQLSINLEGVFVATHAAIAFMKDKGRIINIGSILAEKTISSGQAHYAATKAALVGYTHGWARDLGSKNITVNLIEPGAIDTDMNPDNTDFANSFKKQVPLGRYGKPDEVAAAALFLASDEASYITGATLKVDGGFLA